jgi:hypothetical protein
MESGRLLKTRGRGHAGCFRWGRGDLRDKVNWSHYLLLDREKSLPDLTLSLRTRPEPLQPIDGTTPWRGFVDLSASGETDYPAPWDWPAALAIGDAGLQGFATAC